VESALAVLRPTITSVWMDALSDRSWPDHVAGAVADLQRLGGGRTTGIDLDPQNEDHLRLLEALALHAMHAEAWSERQLVFSANDTGSAVVTSVSPTEEEALRAALSAVGVNLDGVAQAL
jgi:hypothetical protein